VSGLVFAAIAPHGGIVIPELCAPEELHLAAATRGAMEELGRRFDEARPEAVIVATPHNVHVDGHVGVVMAGALEGSVDQIALSCPVDTELALCALVDLADAGVPCVGVSFGPNDPGEATMPLDWGALIPLWYMGGRSEPQVPVVLVAPARDLEAESLMEAGRVLGASARTLGRRVAFVASADHGHAHDAEGPYGFDPAAASYDERIVELVRDNRLAGLPTLDGRLVEAAKADSFWQLLLLHGALDGAFDAELLSYEVPTYFGMLCAAFTPRGS
jgi:aromatic ring-opening dioxygenase LigB subunit